MKVTDRTLCVLSLFLTLSLTLHLVTKRARIQQYNYGFVMLLTLYSVGTIVKSGAKG